MNNFNRLAPVYDFLASLVFGRQIIKSKTHYFTLLTNDQKILIPGGGTGQILEELDKLNMNLSIDYVEKSSKMLEKAKKRKPFSKIKVRFIEGDIFDIESGNYNVIMTNFFLDVFNEKNLSLVVDKLSESLLPNGQWLMADFVLTNVALHRAFVNIMYRFFRLTTNLEGTRLLDFDKELNRAGFSKMKSQKFYHQMIESCVYTKE